MNARASWCQAVVARTCGLRPSRLTACLYLGILNIPGLSVLETLDALKTCVALLIVVVSVALIQRWRRRAVVASRCVNAVT